MRKHIMAAGCVVLFGCGSSASSDGSSRPPAQAPGDVPVNQGQTPSDNANNTPPVGGSAPSGVFVSSTFGSDLGTGSQLNPFKKLSDAMTLAKAQSLPVNACAETYVEAVTLVDGVSMFGYFDCKNGWARIAVNASIVSPTSPVLVAKSITLPTRFAGFDVKAPDFDTMKAADAPSSIALSISDSTNLTFTSITARAGTGAQGEDGTAPVRNTTTFTAPGGTIYQREACGIPRAFWCGTGNTPTTYPNSGGTATCSAGDTSNSGGASGAPRIFLNGSIVAGASMPPVDGRAGAGASPGAGALNGGNGGVGGDGASGPSGQNGQWLLSADGFTVGSGSAGGNGIPGSGGGGGGATTVFWSEQGEIIAQPAPATHYWDTTSGGGAGAGGCAGHAGTAGTGGGASIAALVSKSTVTFEQSRLESSAGGRAGKGTLGTVGSAGQAGAVGLVTVQKGNGLPIAAAGGHGGAGGAGGASGHGAPGPSIALAFSGTHPTLTATDLVPGAAGAGQPMLIGDGSPLTGVVPAVTGVSVAEYTITQ